MARLASASLLLAPLLLAACELDFNRDPDDTTADGLDGDADGDGFEDDQDCDDGDPAVYPGAEEWCNGIDDDCDEEVDEYDAVDVAAWYPDADGDGYGESSGAVLACDAPSGYADAGEDCDDEDANTYPGAAETCGDGVENDCSGATPPCLRSGEIDAEDADARLYGEAEGDNAGHAVAAAGDVNADGFGDILIGAPYFDQGESDEGAAYLVLGPVAGEIGLGAADARLVGKEAGGGAGSAVAGAGDVNADGFDDILVGAPYLDVGATDAGAAYLVLGPVSGEIDLGSADASLDGESTIDWTGWSVAGGADVNGDGADDILVGAPYSDKGGSNAGAAFLLLGPVSGALSQADADAALVGEAEYDAAGRALGFAGDVDGDGLDDVIMGASGSAQGGSNAGAAYLVLGPISANIGLGAADARLVGEAANDGAGGSVAGAGDVDGDGLDDLLVGASGNDNQASDAGIAYLLQGSIRGYSSLGNAHARLLGVAMDDRAGAAVSSAGDTDDDGFDDILVGAPGHDGGGLDAGATFLVLGPITGEVVLASAYATLEAEQASDGMGSALSSAGDVDADGSADILAGAPDYSDGGTDRGAAYLLGVVNW